MKNQITVQSTILADLKRSVFHYAHKSLKKYAQFLSSTIEEEISVKNALRLTHCQVAFMFLVFSANINIILLLICLVWLIVTLLDCKKGGLK